MIEPLVPKECFFTQGVGKHRNQLQSFELALRDAGIEMCNLVRVSSIFPPHCKLISKNAGLRKLQPGEVTYVVLAEASTNEPSRLVGAWIGLALPAAGHQYGYISEHHGYGMTEQRLGDLSRTWRPRCWRPRLGIEFDPNTAYDQRKEIYHMSGKIIKTRAVAQTAEGDKIGPVDDGDRRGRVLVLGRGVNAGQPQSPPSADRKAVVVKKYELSMGPMRRLRVTGNYRTAGRTTFVGSPIAFESREREYCQGSASALAARYAVQKGQARCKTTNAAACPVRFPEWPTRGRFCCRKAPNREIGKGRFRAKRARRAERPPRLRNYAR